MKGYKTGLRGRLACGAVYAAAVMLLTGCGSFAGRTYTKQDLEYLARLEIYEAGSDTPLKIIEDEETLYQYVHAGVFSEYAFETRMQGVFSGDALETEEEGLREQAENAEEAYRIVAYKYPAAKFGEKEPEKNYTITVYEDTNIAKLAAAEESVKNIALPEELLTFYYEISQEEKDLYDSLLP